MPHIDKTKAAKHLASFDRETGDAKKICLAYFGACVASNCLPQIDQDGWQYAYKLQKQLEADFPLTLTLETLKEIRAAAWKLFMNTAIEREEPSDTPF